MNTLWETSTHHCFYAKTHTWKRREWNTFILIDHYEKMAALHSHLTSRNTVSLNIPHSNVKFHIPHFCNNKSILRRFLCHVFCALKWLPVPDSFVHGYSCWHILPAHDNMGYYRWYWQYCVNSFSFRMMLYLRLRKRDNFGHSLCKFACHRVEPLCLREGTLVQEVDIGETVENY